MVIRPTMICACAAPVSIKAAKGHINILQIIQNKFLQIISNLPWDYGTNQLHEITSSKTINEIIENHTEIFNNRSQSSNYELIRNLV